MTGQNGSVATSADGARSASNELLLRETNHRCSNDLQLVIGLLALQSRRASSLEAKQALSDAMERVSVLARARRAMHEGKPQCLNAALQDVCDALLAQAEPRSILVTFEAHDGLAGLSATCITTLALVVNELATNAIKHAFQEGKAGHIRVAIATDSRSVSVSVDDDGLPFPPSGHGSGMGLSLARRMMASVDGLFIQPDPGSKLFELRVPIVS